MKKNDQHEDAMRLTTEYTQLLSRQEGMVQRMLDRKLAQMEPKIEELIDQRIRERLAQMTTNDTLSN